MQHRSFLLSAVVALHLGACTPTPYERFDGEVFAKMAAQKPAFGDTGVLLPVAVNCWLPTIEHWCSPDSPNCRAQPNVTTYRQVACPRSLVPSALSIHAPWGTAYRGEIVLSGNDSAQSAAAGPPDLTGVLHAEIDWKDVDAKPSATNPGKLAKDWSVEAPDGRLKAPLMLSSADVQGVLAKIRKPTPPPKTAAVPAPGPAAPPSEDEQTGQPGEHAELSVSLSNEVDARGTNRIYVAVTNHGPDPAYKVVAQLKSDLEAVNGTRMPFGQLKSGETKRLPKRISEVDPAESDPMVVVELNASNAPPMKTNSRLHLTAGKAAPLLPLQLSCATVERNATPGQKIRIRCESNNPNNGAVQVTSVQLALDGGAPVPATGPAEVAPQGRLMFELTLTIPNNTKAGTLPITIALNTTETAQVQQQIALRISDTSTCPQGKISREIYLAKRKRAMEALGNGSMTQEEFDGYDAALISCLE